jgi:cell wall-associated NlpC family hydrolase
MSIIDTLQQAISEAHSLESYNALATSTIENQNGLIIDLRKTQTANIALLAALRFQAIKVPYKFGAEWVNDKAFDCSSLMQQIFSEAGVKLPRTSRQQAALGQAVDVATFGCLVIIDRDKTGVADHVGMALDDTYMVHTAGNPEGINVCKFRERYAGKILTIRSGFF